MKVLHILFTNKFSGAENVACQIISMMEEDGFDSVYCSTDGPIRDTLKGKDIQFKGLKNFSVKEIRKVIKKVNPDIIHAHDMKATLYSVLSSRHIPIISHIHNNSFDSQKISIKSIVYLFSTIRVRKIIWVSKSAKKDYFFSKFVYKKSKVLYNVIDRNELLSEKKSDNNKYDYEVIFLGRIAEPKNPRRLIDVFEKVIESRKQTQIGIIGTGIMERELVELVKKRELDNNITFLGFQSNPFKILNDAKVMVMTSRWEGTPMCALEAMSLGVPIVSTPTDGLKEIVVDDNTGYLSDEDNVLSLKICEILNNEELYKKLSEKSTERAIKLMDINIYRKNLREIYYATNEYENKNK